MTRHVSIDEARAQLSELVQAAARGDEVVIDSGGGEVRLVASAKCDATASPRQPGSAKGLIWMSDDFDQPLAGDFLIKPAP